MKILYNEINYAFFSQQQNKKIQILLPIKQNNYNYVFNIIFTAWPKKDFQTEDQVRNLVKKKISYIVFHLKKGNNLENLQIEFEKFKCSDCGKDPILFYFDCWIYKFNELLDFNLLELYVNREDGNYFIIVEAKEQKRFLLQFIECILDIIFCRFGNDQD